MNKAAKSTESNRTGVQNQPSLIKIRIVICMNALEHLPDRFVSDQQIGGSWQQLLQTLRLPVSRVCNHHEFQIRPRLDQWQKIVDNEFVFFIWVER